MSEVATGAMQKFGAPAEDAPAGSPGLVLLYAESFATLPAAWPIEGDRVAIGRDESADVRLEVPAVSRQHAEIVREHGEWIVRDLGSRNGTLVDGRVVREARLESEDEIRIGDALLKFVERNAEEYRGYRIDGAMSGAERLAQSIRGLVGGFQMDRISAELERVAESGLTMLVLGESGTGKEVVASEVHRTSTRSGRFCAVNCAAIPGNLLESELFGYKRGAFSGAERDKPGLVRMAHGGTLLLDEIGDMPLEAQAKLLRVLQSKEVFPLGATAPEPVDVRVIAATHQDLLRMQKDGRFRGDLYARLNEYSIRLPPLRERKEDVFLLLRTFLGRQGHAELTPDLSFMVGLLHYDWPFNVRELEACAKRCAALAKTKTIDASHLPEAIVEAMDDYGEPIGSAAPDPGQGTAPSEEDLRKLLDLHKGNVAAVGRELGKARMQVHRWLKRYAIHLADYRS